MRGVDAPIDERHGGRRVASSAAAQIDEPRLAKQKGPAVASPRQSRTRENGAFEGGLVPDPRGSLSSYAASGAFCPHYCRDALVKMVTFVAGRIRSDPSAISDLTPPSPASPWRAAASPDSRATRSDARGSPRRAGTRGDPPPGSRRRAPSTPAPDRAAARPRSA